MLQYNANILPSRVSLRVFVVLHISGLCGVDGVVAAHGTVFTRKPVCSTLAENNVTGNNVLS